MTTADAFPRIFVTVIITAGPRALQHFQKRVYIAYVDSLLISISFFLDFLVRAGNGIIQTWCICVVGTYVGENNLFLTFFCIFVPGQPKRNQKMPFTHICHIVECNMQWQHWKCLRIMIETSLEAIIKDLQPPLRFYSSSVLCRHD